MRITLLLLMLAVPAFPSAAQAQIRVTVNGDPVSFSGAGPQRVEGRVLVPLRGVLEKLGAFVDWSPATRTVVATKGDLDVQLPVGSRFARVNGREVTLDVPAMMIAGTTMVPLRFVGETLGADVRWDAPTQTVEIVTGGERSGLAHRTERAEPEPRPRRTLEVSSITHNLREGWIRAGETIRVTLRGTPGAQARFRIPGVVQEVPMREISPGVYEGAWTVPADRALNLSEARVLGSLTEGGAESPLIQAGDALRVDTAMPRILELYPAENARLTRRRAPVTVSFTDQGGSGVDRAGVRVLLDGKDVTPDATITEGVLTFTPPNDLAPGEHSAEVSVPDRAGNRVTRSWRFFVEERRNPIRSITTNASKVLEPGDVLTVRVEGAPRSQARFHLGSIRGVKLTEESPGVYVGTYTIRKGDAVSRAPLSIEFTTPEGETFTETAAEAVRVSTGPPAVPQILSPQSGEKPASPLVVRGKGTPGSTIRLKIDYVNRVLGIFQVKGTLAEQEIEVPASGEWVSKPIDLSSLAGKSAEYTLTAFAVGPNEERSEAATLRFSGR